MIKYCSDIKVGDALDVYVDHGDNDGGRGPQGLNLKVPCEVNVVNEANMVGEYEQVIGIKGTGRVIEEDSNKSASEDDESDESYAALDATGPEDEGNDVDEEVRKIREAVRLEKKERKNRANRKIYEVILGEAGNDLGFEDLDCGRTYRTKGRLAGDEEFIDSSDPGSDDSREELDSNVVEGVDLPCR